MIPSFHTRGGTFMHRRASCEEVAVGKIQHEAMAICALDKASCVIATQRCMQPPPTHNRESARRESAIDRLLCLVVVYSTSTRSFYCLPRRGLARLG